MRFWKWPGTHLFQSVTPNLCRKFSTVLQQDYFMDKEGFQVFKVRLFKNGSLLSNFKCEDSLSRAPIILQPPINYSFWNLLLLPNTLNKPSIFPSPTSWHTYGFWQVQELIVLQVKVGDLRATSNLFWKMFKLIVRYIQRYEVTQLTWKHTGKTKHQDLQHTGLVPYNSDSNRRISLYEKTKITHCYHKFIK